MSEHGSLEKKGSMILDALLKEYGPQDPFLNFNTAHQLLVATILSAQCTDKRVNMVTRELFRKYSGIRSFADADQSELENDIRSTGFFRNKAKNIIAASKDIMERFGGEVPDTMEGLTSLPGVARKTANIVLSQHFKRPEGIAVDTHVNRLSRRLGLTENKNPDKIESDLKSVFEKKDWILINGLMVIHGRTVCTSRSPRCDDCVIYDYCVSKGRW